MIAIQPTEYPTTQLTVEDKYVELNPKDLARANRETKEINVIYASTMKEMLWTTPFTIPIPGETSGRNFGHRRVFNGDPGRRIMEPICARQWALRFIRRIEAESFRKNLFFTGNTVIVDHGLGDHLALQTLTFRALT